MPELRATARPKKKGKKTHRDHASVAAGWQRAVLDGSFPAGSMMVAAVARQVADLSRQADPEFAYRFDEDAGSRACRFLELLPHVEGPLAGESVTLESWQVWTVMAMFGWVSKETGYPRFRRSTLFMPKGQGKTFLAAGLALYVLATGGKGEKCFSAATAIPQARLSFETARKMLLRRPKVRDYYGLVVEQHRIVHPETGGEYRYVSSEARSLEGVIPSFILEDEIHCHPDRSVHDNLRSSAAKRPDSRMVVISTAGFNMADDAIGYEVYRYARDILKGTITDESQFALLIEADRNLDPWSPDTWRIANPNMGVSIDTVEVHNEANEAKQVPSKQPSFFTKRLGWWCESADSWMDMSAWAAAMDPTLSLASFEGTSAFIGLDMATTRDLSARVLLFAETRDDGQRHYSAFCHAYLAEESPTLKEGNDILRVWAREGFITLDQGGKLSGNVVRDDILRDAERFPGSELCYDDRYATQIAEDVGAYVKPIEIRQGARTQSAPMMELESAVLGGRFRHDGNPVLSWCVSNLLVKTDDNGNIRPSKQGDSRKIDCAVALINAMVRGMLGTEQAYANGEGLAEM